MNEVVEVPQAKARSPARGYSEGDVLTAGSVFLTPKLMSFALDDGTDNAREQCRLLVGCSLLDSLPVLCTY